MLAIRAVTAKEEKYPPLPGQIGHGSGFLDLALPCRHLDGGVVHWIFKFVIQLGVLPQHSAPDIGEEAGAVNFNLLRCHVRFDIARCWMYDRERTFGIKVFAYLLQLLDSHLLLGLF